MGMNLFTLFFELLVLRVCKYEDKTVNKGRGWDWDVWWGGTDPDKPASMTARRVDIASCCPKRP